MNSVHDEGEDSGLLRGRADDPQPADPGDRLRGVRQQVPLVRADGLQPVPVQIIDGRAEGDGPRDVGRSRLELVGEPVVGGLLEGDGADHVASPLVGRHRLEEPRLAVQHSNPGGSVELVAREGVEVAVEVPHVHLHVRHRLGAVEEDRGVPAVRQLDDSADGVDRAEGVGEVRHGDEPGPRPEELLVLLQQQLAPVVDGDDAKDGSLLLAQELPRDDVRVVLHRREDDLVSGLEGGPPVALRHEVDRLRRASDEKDFPVLPRVDEAPHLGTGLLVGGGGALAQGVDAAVDVGIVMGVVALKRLDHRPRLLAGGRVVEIDQGPAVDFLIQDGEIEARAGRIEGLRGRRPRPELRSGASDPHVFSFAAGPTGSRVIKKHSNPVRIGSIGILSMRSLAKAWTRTFRAVSRPIPREQR